MENSRPHWSQPLFQEKIIRVSPLKHGNIDLIILDDKSQWVGKIFADETWLGKTTLEHLNMTEWLATEVARHSNLTYHGNRIIEQENCFAVIRPYFPGSAEQTVSLPQSHVLGQALAKIHALKLIHPQAKPFPRPVIPENIPQRQWLNEIYQQCLSSLTLQSEQMVLSHRDWHVDNFIWSKSNALHLIDWESAGLIHPLIELVGLACNCAGIDREQFQTKKFMMVLTGYQSILGKPTVPNDSIYLLSLHSWILWCVYEWQQGRCAEMEKTLRIIRLMNEKIPLIKKLFKNF